MKKKDIIKKSLEYESIINKKKVVRNRFFSIYYDIFDDTKYGITVPKKVGNAVIRNKIKRQIKNIIDNNKKDIQNNRHYVIIIKRSVLELSYNDIEKFLIHLFKEM